MSNSRAQNWSPSKKRFPDNDYHKRQLPGPGAYYPCDYNNCQGYLLSSFKNGGTLKYIKDSNVRRVEKEHSD